MLLPLFYGTLIIKKRTETKNVFYTRVCNRNRKTDLWFLSNTFYKSLYFVIWGHSGEMRKPENNNPVHILLATGLFAFSAWFSPPLWLCVYPPGPQTNNDMPATDFWLFPFFLFFPSSDWEMTLCTRLSLSHKKKKLFYSQTIGIWIAAGCENKKLTPGAPRRGDQKILNIYFRDRSVYGGWKIFEESLLDHGSMACIHSCHVCLLQGW